MHTNSKHVVIALSGGLDSAVAAVLLLEEGWQVLGVHLLLSDQTVGVDLGALGRFLGIAVRQVDLRQEFQRQVIEYFHRTCRDGRTPNPCVRCNEQIKFGRLLSLVQSWGYPYLATGHYARLAPAGDGGWGLYRGVDRHKEQSYFLHRLRREALGSLLLPLGGWTKAQVRAKAEALGLLPYILPRESQELCFIPGKYRAYLASQLPDVAKRPGPIVNREGVVLGQHRGLAYYTVGQRQGLGIAAAAPYYVLALIPEANQLVVGGREDLLAEVVEVEAVHWLVEPEAGPLRATVRLRYRHPGVGCLIQPRPDGRARVTLEQPQAAITPGQAAVFYRGDQVLGGGWITGGQG
ncbi:MAG: tRNA 2-thiouridine(34) synthase MnmA [Desulfobacca sp.]|uniref:tRNA 2-thiouridine(34) synthase MnmA n=1 Tax=Desulfobacca sp. TaxID=2067990 RepID=UPI004049D18E